MVSSTRWFPNGTRRLKIYKARSARKAQMVAAEYKKKGGGYKGGEGKKQKDLKKWGKEKWMTKDEYEKRKKARGAAKKYKDSKK